MNEMPISRRVKKPASKYDRPASLNPNLRPITRKEFFAIVDFLCANKPTPSSPQKNRGK